MIDRIIVRNFKSLHEIDLSLGRMNLFIGDNSSGKSNFLEVFRVLQGIGRGLTIREVLDGVPGDGCIMDWLGVRGGSANVYSAGNPVPSQEVTIRAQGTLEEPASGGWDFAITFTPTNGNVALESLKIGSDTVYSVKNSPVPFIAHLVEDRKLRHMTSTHTTTRPNHGDLRVKTSIPSHIAPKSQNSSESQKLRRRFNADNSNTSSAILVADSLANFQQIDPFIHFLREEDESHQVDRMGDHCKNFIAFIRTICQTEKSRDQYLSWMREFSAPHEEQFGDVLASFVRPHCTLNGGLGKELGAFSDGTLRFAALVAAFFQFDMPEVMLIDEIETSIHASRARLFVELLGNRAGCRTTQVIATTHSPVILEWLKDTDLANTFFCNRDHDTGASVIRPLLEVPRSEGSLQGRHFFDVLTERWLELIS